jgi:hypothetical protein
MKTKCPICGQSAYHQVARSEYAPVAPQVAGGVAVALVFVLSRKRRFHCEKCGEYFYSHTIGSRLWFVLWTLFWLLVAFAIIGILIPTSSIQ